MRCVDCGERINLEEGVGLVEERSGDDGGMYDYCMMSDDDKHHITSLKPGDDVAWEFETDADEDENERWLKSKGLW